MTLELSEQVKKEFLEQVEKELPRESCGLVAVIKGRQQYFSCKNIAENNCDFILDPKDYIGVEDFVSEMCGDIVAVVHSHPTTRAKPTMADLVGCENSGLPWAIYSPKNQEWNFFSPTGYKAPLIGRSFKHGVFDCYSAVRDWYSQKLKIDLPDFLRNPKWWEKGENILMENFAIAGFEQVVDGSLNPGDCILFTLRSPVVNHCAVYIGDDQVFHQTLNRLSSREIYGGWLKKNTRMVVRYKT